MSSRSKNPRPLPSASLPVMPLFSSASPAGNTHADKTDAIAGNLAQEKAADNTPTELTVSALTLQIRKLLEGTWAHVRVRGEIGECRLHNSGHLYLSLKDADNTLAAVCWRAKVVTLGIRPQTGMDVVAIGRLTAYGGQSRYQLVIDRIELAGVGALLQLLEERKKKLAAEGLFAEARKKSLPFLPEVIGVVTSPTGAVIRDILHRLADRFPRRVLVWATRVQGDGAAETIAAAVAGFNSLVPGDPIVPRPDVIIVARGGGSLEDLMPFNEEIVVRAVADSVIPVITAIGHETDTTLVDYAADRRAPTPTAAAEMAVPVRAEIAHRLARDGIVLTSMLRRTFDEMSLRLSSTARLLGDPARLLETATQRLDDLSARLSRAFAARPQALAANLVSLAARLRHPRDIISNAGSRLAVAGERIVIAARARLQNASRDLSLPSDRMARCATIMLDKARAEVMRSGGLLEACSPSGVMKRGYAIVHQGGGLLTSAANARVGERALVEFHDGSVTVTVAVDGRHTQQS